MKEYRVSVARRHQIAGHGAFGARARVRSRIARCGRSLGDPARPDAGTMSSGGVPSDRAPPPRVFSWCADADVPLPSSRRSSRRSGSCATCGTSRTRAWRTWSSAGKTRSRRRASRTLRRERRRLELARGAWRRVVSSWAGASARSGSCARRPRRARGDPLELGLRHPRGRNAQKGGLGDGRHETSPASSRGDGDRLAGPGAPPPPPPPPRTTRRVRAFSWCARRRRRARPCAMPSRTYWCACAKRTKALRDLGAAAAT